MTQKDKKKTINLALQGGGAHGAFTWGVLEHLLQDGRFDFHTISGTSAGSMNAAVMATGLLQGGNAKAIELLEVFWRRISQSGRFGGGAFPQGMAAFQAPMNAMAAGAYMGFDMMSRMFSPYQFNPLGLNPLKDILLELVDFKRIQVATNLKLFISATDVLRSRLRLFTDKDITVEALLASACLPQLFQAIEIDGHYYWDGGYMGNPTLFPLTKCQHSQDILIVQIDPVHRDDVPKTAEAIADRLNEISFNSPLLVELRGLHLVNELLKKGHLKSEECGLRPLHLHVISDEKTMAAQPLESKFNPAWDFLLSLREAGNNAAKKWLAAHAGEVGNKSSVNMARLIGADGLGSA